MEASCWQGPLVSILPIEFCPLYLGWDMAVWGSWARSTEWNVYHWAEAPVRGSLGSESGGRRGHGFPLGWLNSYPSPAFNQWLPLFAWVEPAAGSMWTTGFICMWGVHQLGMKRSYCLNWDHLDEKHWFKILPRLYIVFQYQEVGSSGGWTIPSSCFISEPIIAPNEKTYI